MISYLRDSRRATKFIGDTAHIQFRIQPVPPLAEFATFPKIVASKPCLRAYHRLNPGISNAQMLDDIEVKRLILRTAVQDAQAFSLLYQRTAPTLMGVAMRITRRREMAEEVLHDAFVKVWNQAKSFDPLALQAVAWLTAIVRNRALDVVTSAEATRVESYDQQSDDDGDALERLIDWSDQSDSGEVLDGVRTAHSLRGCFAALKPAERQAIALAYHHGMSHSELADHLQKPIGTVKSWVRRGLEALRVCMETCAGATR